MNTDSSNDEKDQPRSFAKTPVPVLERELFLKFAPVQIELAIHRVKLADNSILYEGVASANRRFLYLPLLCTAPGDNAAAMSAEYITIERTVSSLLTEVPGGGALIEDSLARASLMIFEFYLQHIVSTDKSKTPVIKLSEAGSPNVPSLVHYAEMLAVHYYLNSDAPLTLAKLARLINKTIRSRWTPDSLRVALKRDGHPWKALNKEAKAKAARAPAEFQAAYESPHREQNEQN